MASPPAVRLHCSAAGKPIAALDGGDGSSSGLSRPRPHGRPRRYAVLGAGFAGLSVAWHLLKCTPRERDFFLDIYDENGIGRSASGNSGGLLHPYSPKAKLLWYGADFWEESLELLHNAEQAITNSRFASEDDDAIIVRRGIIRPAMAEKNVDIFVENARSCFERCPLRVLDRDATQSLVPDLSVPFNLAVHMPLAIGINPKKYLQSLFTACQNLADELSVTTHMNWEINLIKEPLYDLNKLGEEYDDIIICLGAKVALLPELAGKLPLRMCRGVIAELGLPTDERGAGEYPSESPNILSDAWLAFRGPRRVAIGSTWDWESRNYAPSVSAEESSIAMEELLLKAATVYPEIYKWKFMAARAGLRAMPPVTQYGSLPLMGCVDELIGNGDSGRFWLVGGLGSRGLLYHGLAGKLAAQAVVSQDENVIPSEFTSWKTKKLPSDFVTVTKH